jgi:integrase
VQADGMKASYTYALHSRLSQICSDAVHDGVLGRNPCSRRTSPPRGKAKVYVATTEQVWAIHDAVPDHLRVAVLLGAFAGLRIAEVSGLRVTDVDFIRGVVHPKQQWPGGPLKTEGSDQPIPIPRDLALLLSASVQKYPSEMMVTNGPGTDRCPPWIIEYAIRSVREKIDGLPEEFTFHDLRQLPGVAADRVRCGHQDGAGADAPRQCRHDSRCLRAPVARRRRVDPHRDRRRNSAADRNYCGPAAG